MTPLLRLPLQSACVAVLACALSAQMRWSPIPTQSNILARDWAYDARRDRVVAPELAAPRLFTTEFDGQTWSRSAVLPPQDLNFISVGFDEARGQVVWHGENQVLLRMETWRWDGSRWIGSAQHNGPGFRIAPMAYHRGRRTLMMFGGWMAQDANELWEWDGRQWLKIKDRTAPPGSNQYQTMEYDTLAYDAERDVIVVFGRRVYQAFGPTLDFPETWEWISSLGWRLVSTSGPSYGNRRVIYDSWRRTLVLLNIAPGAETWERTGSGPWVLRQPSSSGFYPIYDSRRGRTLVPFAQYAPNLPADFTTTGAGCPGTLGTPSLELTEPWTRAWFGDVLSVTVRNLPQSAAILATGFSTQATGGIALPADLGAYGMPGCFLRVAVDDYAPLVGSNGSATHARTVPSSFALLGLAYHLQAVALDAAANAFGATMSNAVTGHVGQR